MKKFHKKDFDMFSGKETTSSSLNNATPILFDPNLRETERYKSLCKLVEEEGLQGLYNKLEMLGIGKDLYLSADDFMDLASYDKDYQWTIDQLPVNEQQNSSMIQEDSFPPSNYIKTVAQHPDVKEKNGEGMEYILALLFNSWEVSIKSHPSIIFIPKTIVGLQNLVKWAQKENKRVRCAGYRHTSSEMYSDDHQILVSMLDLKTATVLPADHPSMDPNSDLQGIQLIGDPYEKDGKMKVKCKLGASTCNYHLQEWVHSPSGGNWKWTLPLNVIMSEITFGGSNATICHGAGINTKTLSDLVTEIEFVNVKGELQTVNDKEQLKAAAGCFGMLGIVTSLTLELDAMTYANLKTAEKKLIALTIPPPEGATLSKQLKKNLSKRNLKALANPKKLKQAFNDFIDRCENSYYAEWFWFPLQHKGWINCWKNNGDKTNAVRYPSQLTTEEQRASSYLAHLAINMLDDNRQTPLLRKMQTKLMGDLAMAVLPHKKDITCSVHDALHFRKGIQNFKTRLMEVEIPIPDIGDTNKPDWSICQKAWWAVIESTYSKKNLTYYPMRTTLEMRVMGGSDSLMAAQYNNKRTCSIEILTPISTNSKRWDEFLQEILDKWTMIKDDKGRYLNIRPHWAKRFDYLIVNRDKTWMNEWNPEQKILLSKYVKDDNNIISIPMREYLKTIAYKEQIPNFMRQINAICKQGGYEYKDIKERFSNSLLDEMMSSGLSLQSRLQNVSFFKPNNRFAESDIVINDEIQNSKKLN